MTSTTRSQVPDIVTLEDLAPRRTVVGGSERRIFGSADRSEPRAAAPSNQSLGRSIAMAGKTKKDLPAKKTIKGGRLGANDNMTLVRAAKPKKDLPAKKTIKGGRIPNKNV